VHLQKCISALTVARMNKARALELLGGSVSTVAEAVGVSSAAVSQWPDELPARIEDRILAALARKHLPAELIGGLAVLAPTEPAQAGVEVAHG